MLATMGTEQPQWLADETLLGDAVRVVIIVSGFILCGITLKLAISAMRARDWEKAAALASYGLFVVTPSISGLYRFNLPLNLYTSLTYMTALGLGLVATAYRVTLRSKWLHVRRMRRARERARRDREQR